MLFSAEISTCESKTFSRLIITLADAKFIFQFIAKAAELFPFLQKTLTHPRNMMLGSWDEIRLLASLCQAMGAKKTLDIGKLWT